MSASPKVIEIYPQPGQPRPVKPRRERGRGSVYKPKYRTKDGQLRESPNWSIQYSRYGQVHRESTGSDKKTVAERLLRKRFGEIETGLFVGPKTEKVRFEELAEDLLNDYRNKGNKSLERAERSVAYLKLFFQGMRVVDITTDKVGKYYALRQMLPGDEGTHPILSRGASNATVNREVSALKRMFHVGMEQTPPKVRYIPYIKLYGESDPRQGFFKQSEYIRLLRELPPYLRPVVTMGYYTGMRLQEILGLRWEQVDLLSRTIHLAPFDTKNNEPRLVNLGNGELYETIIMQRQIRDAKCPDCTRVFFRRGERILSFRKAWNSACRRAGIFFLGEDGSSIHPIFHDLRRTAARNLRRAGVSEKVIMQIGGWKTRIVFERYNIVDERDIKEAASKLDAFIANENRQSSDKVALSTADGQQVTH